MASLIENLIHLLEEENKEYKLLIEISNEKTPVIVSGDLEALNNLVAKEQARVNKITNLEKDRTQVVEDIATVLNKKPEKLNVKAIVELLKGQDAVQKKLAIAHDELKQTLKEMVAINELNKNLIKESLELIEFNMNYLKSLQQGPENANYGKDAYNFGNQQGAGAFDAKQ